MVCNVEHSNGQLKIWVDFAEKPSAKSFSIVAAIVAFAFSLLRQLVATAFADADPAFSKILVLLRQERSRSPYECDRDRISVCIAAILYPVARLQNLRRSQT